MINLKLLGFLLLLLAASTILVFFLVARKRSELKPITLIAEQQNGTDSRHRAPMRGPSRQALIAILLRSDAEQQMPITLADNSPDAVVRKEGDLWVIRALVEDNGARKNAGDEAMAAGKPFRDENSWAFRHPGPILVKATTKENFIRAIEKMRWDYGEEDGRGEKPFLK